MKMFNSATLWCWLNDYPPNCEGSLGEPGPIPCERGKHAWLFRWIFYYAPIWLILVLTGYLMFMLWYKVNEQSKKVAKYDIMLKLNKSLSEKEKQNMKKNSKSNERARKVASQAFFFMGALFLTFLPGTMNRLTQLVSGKSIYALLVWQVVFDPAQGFLNFLVYMRPRMIHWSEKRNKRDTTTRWIVFSTAWFSEICLRKNSRNTAGSNANEDDDEYVDMYNEEEITDSVKVKESLPTLKNSEANRDNDDIVHDEVFIPAPEIGVSNMDSCDVTALEREA